MLTNLQYKLIEHLNKSKDWHKSNELVLILGCSTRTLRSLVKEINDSKMEEWIISSKLGYRLNLNKLQEIEDQLNQYYESPFNFNVQQRHNYLLKKILIDGSIDIDLELDYLYISESTLHTNINNIKDELSKSNINITKQQNSYVLYGPEKQIRLILSEKIYDEVENGILTFKKISRIFPELDIEVIKATVIRNIKKYGYYVNDFSLLNIVLHLCVAIERLKRNYIISNVSISDEEKHNELKSNYDELSESILNDLKNSIKFEYSSEESVNLAILLMFNIRDYELLENENVNINEYVQKQYTDFTKLVIDRVLEKYSLDLNNPDFTTRFSLHIQQLIKNKSSIKNPLIENIKKNYPLVFDVSIYISELIRDNFNYNPNIHDVSFIALHVGISLEYSHSSKLQVGLMTFNYHSITHNIFEKIHSVFKNEISLQHVYSDVTTEETNFDFIITTPNFEENETIESVVISPFVSDHDIHTISEKIAQVNLRKLTNYNGIVRFFDRRLFRIIDSPLQEIDGESTIKEICEDLVETNLVNPDYYLDVIYRESLSSTSYLNIAMPHAMNEHALKTVLPITIYKNKALWGSNFVNTVILLAISEKDKDHFKSIFENLIKILTSEKYNNSIKNINNFNDFMNVLESII